MFTVLNFPSVCTYMFFYTYMHLCNGTYVMYFFLFGCTCFLYEYMITVADLACLFCRNHYICNDNGFCQSPCERNGQLDCLCQNGMCLCASWVCSFFTCTLCHLYLIVMLWAEYASVWHNQSSLGVSALQANKHDACITCAYMYTSM